MLKLFSTLLALGTVSRAWRAEFSEATQCGTVTVTWAATTTESIGPPFVVRAAAFGLAPLIFNVSASAWSSSTRTGSFSFTVPWPEGTRFLSVMDDGFGLGTGGVSGIQTVKSSSNLTCIDSSITQPSQTFDITSSFAQCSSVSMNWTEPATSLTRVAGLIPSGVAFQLDPPLVGSKSTTWDLNIEAGTAFVLIYNDGAGNAMTSSLLQSLGGSNTVCLASGAYPSATASQTEVAQATATGTTISSAMATPSTSSSESNSSNSRSNLGPILGAVFGALALIGVLGLGGWLALRRRRRKQVVPQTPELTKEVDFDAQNTRPNHQPGSNRPGSNSRHPKSSVVLPFVLPYNGSRQQDTPSHSTRKHPVRDTSRDMSDSSHVYTTSTSVSQSNPAPRSDVDDEPMIIRHEDAGAVIPPRSREVIELPPGYHEVPRAPPPRSLPRPLPVPQISQQEIPQTPSQKLSVSN